MRNEDQGEIINEYKWTNIGVHTLQDKILREFFSKSLRKKKSENFLFSPWPDVQIVASITRSGLSLARKQFRDLNNHFENISIKQLRWARIWIKIRKKI